MASTVSNSLLLLLPHEKYPYRIAPAEEENILGSDLLHAINGISYNHYASGHCVVASQDPMGNNKSMKQAIYGLSDQASFHEAVCNKLRRIAIKQFCDEAKEKDDEKAKAYAEYDHVAVGRCVEEDPMCNKKSMKQFCDEAEEMDKEAEKAYAEYENEDEVFLEILAEKGMKKQSHKWSLNRRLSRNKH